MFFAALRTAAENKDVGGLRTDLVFKLRSWIAAGDGVLPTLPCRAGDSSNTVGTLSYGFDCFESEAVLLAENTFLGRCPVQLVPGCIAALFVFLPDGDDRDSVEPLLELWLAVDETWLLTGDGSPPFSLAVTAIGAVDAALAAEASRCLLHASGAELWSENAWMSSGESTAVDLVALLPLCGVELLLLPRKSNCPRSLARDEPNTEPSPVLVVPVTRDDNTASVAVKSKSSSCEKAGAACACPRRGVTESVLRRAAAAWSPGE